MVKDLNETKFVEVANQSLEILGRFLFGKGDIAESESERLRVASSTLSSYVRFKTHQGNMLAVKSSLITRLTDNKEELREYLTVSLPELKLAKALPVGKES